MNNSRAKRSILFMKYYLWRRDAISFYRALMRNERLSRDELDSVNWEKRKALLSYACERVPFYRRKYSAAGLHPGDIARPEDYERVPILTKEELRSNFQDLLSEDTAPKYLREASTGGSTGMPVRVMYDTRVPREAFEWRVLNWWGVTPGGNAAFVWRLIRKGLKGRLYRVAQWPAKRIYLDAACMTPRAMEEFVEKFNRLRPELLQGYVGAIYHLALHIEEKGLRVHSPKAIWVTSSPVTTSQRRRIESVFHGPVYDQYGCGEVFWLAAQCREQSGLHIFHDARHIEFVDEAGRARPCGQIGRIVVTDLENRAFPIIRYENGDMGRSLEEACPCGLSLPVMDTVSGRVTDLVKLPGGTCMSGDYLTTIFDAYPGAVKAFQVRQQSDYSIRLIYIPDSNPQELSRALTRVKQDLVQQTKAEVPISLEAVAEIPHDRGKLRFVVSDVKAS